MLTCFIAFAILQTDGKVVRAPRTEWEILTDRAIWGHGDDELAYPTTRPDPEPNSPARWDYLPQVDGAQATGVLRPWIGDSNRPAPETTLDAQGSDPSKVGWIAIAGAFPTSALCAHADVIVSEDQVRMARLTGAAWMLVNGEPFVGDVERRDFRGVPVRLRKGSNSVFVASQGSAFELEFLKPLTRLVIESADIRWPEDGLAFQDLFFPIWNASVKPAVFVHVHYGHAGSVNNNCTPSITEWQDGGYIVPLGLQLASCYYTAIHDCKEQELRPTGRDVLLPISVYSELEYADRRLLHRGVAHNAGTSNNFENVSRTADAMHRGMLDLWNSKAVHILPTGGDRLTTEIELARARFLQQRCWYVRGDAPVVTNDKEYLPVHEVQPNGSWLAWRVKDAPIVLYGNASTNTAWSKFVTSESDIEVRPGRVRIHGVDVDGDDLAGWFVFRQKERDVVLLFDTGANGARLGIALAAAWMGVPGAFGLYRASDTAASGWEPIEVKNAR